MCELSSRLKEAVEFIIKNGYAKNRVEISKKLGVTSSTLSMATNGFRDPTVDLMAKLCDIYPISLDWLRKGEGSMVKGARELELLRRIEILENRIKELEK